MKKLKGFTLMELLIVMVLSAIVIASAGLCFKFTIKRYHNYTITNNKNLQLASLYSVLEGDLKDAIAVYKRENRIECCSNDTVVYCFERDYVLRKVNDVADTFLVATDHLQMNLNGQNVEKGLVDELSIKVNTQGDTVGIRLAKIYSAEELMQNEAAATESINK